MQNKKRRKGMIAVPQMLDCFAYELKKRRGNQMGG